MVTVCDSNFLFGEGERERSTQRNRWCWIDRLLCEENEKQRDIDSKVDSEYFVLRKTFFDPLCYLSCMSPQQFDLYGLCGNESAQD